MDEWTDVFKRGNDPGAIRHRSNANLMFKAERKGSLVDGHEIY